NRQQKALLSLDRARLNRENVPFDDLPTPAFTGLRVMRPSIEELREMVDWTFLFLAWQLKGKYPQILEQPVARELFDDANKLLDQIIADGTFQAVGAYGFWPAHAEGDDILLDNGVRFPMLRQQTEKPEGRPNRCLADYIAPSDDHLGPTGTDGQPTYVPRVRERNLDGVLRDSHPPTGFPDTS
ncbi:vitamin B12 dependent-methionine synthase activation domain-containing protein, partial [Kibdelosporangium lantanae]